MIWLAVISFIMGAAALFSGVLKWMILDNGWFFTLILGVVLLVNSYCWWHL